MGIAGSVRFLVAAETQVRPGCGETDCRLRVGLCGARQHQQSNPHESYRELR